MRAKIEAGDLVYHEFTNSYGWVIEVGRPTIEPIHADTQVEWTSGQRTWNFYSSVLEWKRKADKEKKNLDREKEVG